MTTVASADAERAAGVLRLKEKIHRHMANATPGKQTLYVVNSFTIQEIAGLVGEQFRENPTTDGVSDIPVLYVEIGNEYREMMERGWYNRPSKRGLSNFANELGLHPQLIQPGKDVMDVSMSLAAVEAVHFVPGGASYVPMGVPIDLLLANLRGQEIIQGDLAFYVNMCCLPAPYSQEVEVVSEGTEMSFGPNVATLREYEQVVSAMDSLLRCKNARIAVVVPRWVIDKLPEVVADEGLRAEYRTRISRGRERPGMPCPMATMTFQPEDIYMYELT